MLGRPAGNTSPVGLLERWDARNQELVDRQMEEAAQWSGEYTDPPEWKPARWHVALAWWFFLSGVAGIVFGIVEGNIGRVAMGAASVMIWGLELAVWQLVRRNHW